jgi:hypothetical protein
MKRFNSFGEFSVHHFNELDVPWYALLTVSTLVLLGVIYSFDQIGLHIPLVYVGDGLAAAESVKTILETGWYLFNPNVGAPFGQYMAAYPNSDGFSFLLIKIIGIFTDDWAVAMNVFYFLTYILAALASFWAMRKWVCMPAWLISFRCYTRSFPFISCVWSTFTLRLIM